MADYRQQKAEAERLFADGSYQKAHEAYKAVEVKGLSAVEKRWVAFRIVDADWRAAGSSTNRDQTRLNKDLAALQKMVAEAPREEDRDRVWAEVHESLGDFYWVRPDFRNWWQAWQFYQPALDWWAGADVDLETARARYLSIVWRAVKPSQVDQYYYYGYYGNQLPVDVLENVLQIVKSDDDKARAHYLMATALKNQGGDYEQAARVSEEFEASLKLGKKTEWYDDALYNYAQYLESYGRPKQQENGSFTREQDFVGALALYQRFLAEYKKGESRWWDSAKSQADAIVAPVLSVGVSNIFLPDSQLQYYLSWRNVPRIDLSLYKVDLSTINLGKDDSSGSWLQRIDVSAAQKVKGWSKDTADKGDYRPGSSQEILETLPIGAYLLEGIGKSAAGVTIKARDLVLITRTNIVIKSAPSKTVLYVCDATTGAPKPKAATTLRRRYYKDSEWHWTTRSLVADDNGIAEYPRDEKGISTGDTNSSGDLFASAQAGDEQAYSVGSAPGRESYNDGWKIYAFTDRPAYRPGEKAQWKILARVYDRASYQTPAGKAVNWVITDPQSSKVAEGKATLNAFGSAWGELALTDKMPLGEYTITFNTSPNNTVGSAVLLRLEEYKLPEFQVSVKTPDDGAGHRKTYRVGDKVTAEVQVDYYFGGAVADADVELLVYQSPYFAWWQPMREYPWFYEDMMPSRPYWYGGGGSVIKQERIKTDATGKAQVTFDTPRGANQDFEYRVEARVTDSSRREVSGSGSVRVTRQKFYAYLTPQHQVLHPHDKVVVDVKTLDANEEPFPAEGTVQITRDHYWERWLDPKGKEISGDDYAALSRSNPAFNGAGYRLKFRGYQHEDVETRTVKTDANGEASIAFTPEKDGYYHLTWTTPEKGRNPVKAEAYVWVASASTSEIGYRHGGLEILLDKDTVKPGATVPVMLSVPGNDRWVLFSVGADDLYRYELVHLTGTVKLMEVKMEDSYVPNVFLDAQMVHDQQLFQDVKQVVVPPIKHYLTVEVAPDKKEYQARDEGTWTVTTKDDTGKPVAAEVAVGVVDESVYAIQSELAGDPRQFYFGQKRPHNVQTQSSFNQKGYAKVVPTPPPTVETPVNPEQPGDLDEMQKDDEGGAGEDGRFQDRAKSARGPAPTTIALGAAAAAPKSAMHSASGEKAKKESDAPPPPPGMPPAKPSSGGEEPAVVVRSDFRATAFWGPQVTTDASGRGSITLKYPDSLTTWRATARASSTSAQFGITTGSVKTRMPLLVRLQGPRFYVVGDVTVVSAVVNNNTDHEISATAQLEAKGLTVVEGRGEARSIKVPPGGETRVDWKVKVETAGEAALKVIAKGGGFADAMEKSYPVFEHGVDKLVAKSGKMRSGSVTVKLPIPKERREGSTELSVQVSPSMAVTMLDALPYLIDYPYGCTEQTMSRFLPAVIVRKTLTDLGIDAKKAMARSFGGVEPEFADKTHPKGKQDLKDLDAMTTEGLKRLYDFQHGDGGWGWWKQGESDRYMSAYVLWGLSLARDSGIEVRKDVMSRAAEYLGRELVSEKENHDRQAWILHALSAYWAPHHRKEISAFEKKAFDNLWANHKTMNAYTRALFALTAFRYGFADQAKTLAQNLENGAIKDDKPDTSLVMEGAQSSDASVMGTAHWGEDTGWWRWSDSGIETTSFAIMALLTIDPKNALVEPSVNWLIKNRRGSQWSNTKDTAFAVMALAQYLKVSGEIGSEVDYSVTVNGKEIARKHLSKDDALGAPSKFVVDPSLVRDANEIKVARVSGTGPLYFSAEARFFSLEEPVTPAGHEIFVRRKYFKKVGRKTLLKGYVYDTVPLEDGGQVTSGDRIEVVVTVEAKNDYEYLLFEDLKPAGFEAVELKSGTPLYARQVVAASFDRNYGKIDEDGKRGGAGLGASTDPIDYTGEQRSIYQELRDRKVALFADHLKQGVWEMRYEMRAEVPGKFHALPVLGQAMYVPEIRANSAEVRVEVVDRK